MPAKRRALAETDTNVMTGNRAKRAKIANDAREPGANSAQQGPIDEGGKSIAPAAAAYSEEQPLAQPLNSANIDMNYQK